MTQRQLKLVENYIRGIVRKTLNETNSNLLKPISGISINAHSDQQYKKWKDYLDGKYEVSDMTIIAQTYVNEINKLFGSAAVRSADDDIVFKSFATYIQPARK